MGGMGDMIGGLVSGGSGGTADQLKGLTSGIPGLGSRRR